MKQIVNLTPHVLVLVVDENESLEYQPASRPARVSSFEEPVGNLFGVPTLAVKFGEITGLPEPQEGTLFVVSAMVATVARATGRTDVASPGRLVRDGQGHVIGAGALIVA